MTESRNTLRLTDGVVVLDRLTVRDAEAHLAGEDEEQAKRFGWYPAKSTLATVRAMIRKWGEEWRAGGTTRLLAVRDARSGALVGGCELRLQAGVAGEMSYWTFPAYRRKGHATRAVILTSSWAFRDLGVARLELRIEPDNASSQAVAETAGFIKQGLVEGHLKPGAAPSPMVLYRRERGEPTIRVALPSDAAPLAEVHIRSWQWAYRGQLPGEFLDGLSATMDRRTTARREYLEQQPQGERTWAVEMHGGITGFADAGPSRDQDRATGTGEVYAIYLDEQATGKGIGQALFDRAVQFLRGQGHREATLWVLASNSRARAFYEKAGWKPDGELKVEERPGFELREIRYRTDL